tara:strand:- start:531 stop:1913 length:1383 start_codon:yes stop_codon:yes gene_type:complete
MNNFDKYLKYKYKYINLKNKIKGGIIECKDCGDVEKETKCRNKSGKEITCGEYSDFIKDTFNETSVFFEFLNCKDIIKTFNALNKKNPEEIIKLSEQFNFYKKNYSEDSSSNLKRFKIDCYASNLKMVGQFVRINKNLFRIEPNDDVKVIRFDYKHLISLGKSGEIYSGFTEIEDIVINYNVKNFSSFFDKYYYIDDENNLICNKTNIISNTNKLLLNNTYEKISGGYLHVLFLDKNNDMYVLGNNFHGQLGLKLEDIDSSDYDYLYFTNRSNIIEFSESIFSNEINEETPFKISKEEIIRNISLLSENYKIVFVSKPIKSKSNVINIFSGKQVSIYQDKNEKTFILGSLIHGPINEEKNFNLESINNKIKKIYFQQNGGYIIILDYTGKLYFIGASLYLTKFQKSNLNFDTIIDFSVLGDNLYRENRKVFLLISYDINKFKKVEMTFLKVKYSKEIRVF